MPPESSDSLPFTDRLDGVDAIAEYLGNGWNARRVRYARETGMLPIRAKPVLGVYAFKSDLDAAFRSSDSLPPLKK